MAFSEYIISWHCFTSVAVEMIKTDGTQCSLFWKAWTKHVQLGYILLNSFPKSLSIFPSNPYSMTARFDAY